MCHEYSAFKNFTIYKSYSSRTEEAGTKALFCSQSTALLELKNHLYLWKSLDKLSVKLFICDIINGYARTKPKGWFCLKDRNITVPSYITCFFFTLFMSIGGRNLKTKQKKMYYVLAIFTSTFESFSPFHVKRILNNLGWLRDGEILSPGSSLPRSWLLTSDEKWARHEASERGRKM